MSVNSGCAFDLSSGMFPSPPSPDWNRASNRLPPDCAGLYFVYEGGECVYVGESVNLRQRMSGHPHVNKHRNVGFMQCSANQRRRLEAFFIGLLDPRLNSQSSQYQATRKRKAWRPFSDANYISSASKRNAARRRSVFRKSIDIIGSTPGLSLSEFHAALGWKTEAKLIRAVLVILSQWRFIRRIKVRTYGRTKEILFLYDHKQVFA
jgi:hypothetical protein